MSFILITGLLSITCQWVCNFIRLATQRGTISKCANVQLLMLEVQWSPKNDWIVVFCSREVRWWLLRHGQPCSVTEQSLNFQITTKFPKRTRMHHSGKFWFLFSNRHLVCTITGKIDPRRSLLNYEHIYRD